MGYNKNFLQLNNYEDNIYREHSFSEFERNDMFKKQMIYFINSLQNNKKPLTALEEVIGGHMTVLSIKKVLESCEFTKVI